MDPCRREAWRAEARARRAESRCGVPDRRPGVFEHSRHTVWFLWHLSSVRCLDSTQQSGVSQQKGTGSVIRGSESQIRGAGSEIRLDPPQFNPCSRLPTTSTHDAVLVSSGKAEDDCETFRTAPLVSNKTIRISDEERWKRHCRTCSGWADTYWICKLLNSRLESLYSSTNRNL